MTSVVKGTEAPSRGKEAMFWTCLRMSSMSSETEDLAMSLTGLRASAKAGLRALVLESRRKERLVTISVIS